MVSGVAVSEKRKWFDQRPPPEIPAFTAAAGCSAEDCHDLLAMLARLRDRGRISKPTYRLFCKLATMGPPARLSRNLSITVRILATRGILDPLKDGLAESELEALRELGSRSLPWRLQAVAQSLLNINERCQLNATIGRAFKEERARKWPLDEFGEPGG
jgi:hypothetical protein